MEQGTASLALMITISVRMIASINFSILWENFITNTKARFSTGGISNLAMSKSGWRRTPSLEPLESF
jgi:hypothetical protein